MLGTGTSLGTGTFTVNGGANALIGSLSPANAVVLNADFIMVPGASSSNFTGPFSLTGHRTIANRSTASATIGSAANSITGAATDLTLETTDPARTLTVNGPIATTTGSLTKNGAGSVVLTAASSYSGSTTVNAGTFTLNGNGATASTSAYAVKGSTFSVDNSVTAVSGRLGAGDMELDNVIFNFAGKSGSSTAETIDTLELSGGGSVVTLTGNSVGQTTTITAAGLARANRAGGLVRANNLGVQATDSGLIQLTTAPSSAAGTLIGGGGTPGGSAKNVSIVPFLVGDVSATGYGTTFVGYDATHGLRGLSLVNEFVTFTASGANLGTMAAGENARINSGTLTAFALTGSTMPNAVVFNQGLTSGAVIYTLTGTLTPQAGAILFARTSASARAATLTGGTIQFASSDSATSRQEGIINNSNASSATINSQISGTGGLTLNTYNTGSRIGLGSTANDYTGTTTVNGLLRLGAAGVIPDASDVRVARGGTFDLYGFSETIDALNGAGTVDTSAATASCMLTLGANGSSGDFGGLIKNSGATGAALSLTKTGTGTQTLAGANTYSGTTTVGVGTLLIDGDQSGATNLTTVASGAKLGGNGIVGGSVTLSSGGALKPYDTGAGVPSTLRIAGDLDLGNGTLDLSGLGVVAFGSHVLVEFASKTGAAFATVTGKPSGTAVTYSATQVILGPSTTSGTVILLR